MDNATHQNIVEPFFFEKSLKKLYGCHHRPSMGMEHKPFVVICSPIGQEYIRSHRALYNLANNLAREGHDVLRFDYSGCGDSEGDFEKGSLLEWEQDVIAAIEEMRYRCAHSDAILIGLRIGGTLAVRAAVGDRHVRKIVLWEPIVDGYVYLNEIRAMQTEFVEWLRPRNRELFISSGGQEEVVGFLMNRQLISEIKGINISSFNILQEYEKMLLLNDKEGNQSQSVQQFLDSAVHLDVFFCNEPKLWNEQLFRRIIPVNSIKEIVTWVNRI